MESGGPLTNDAITAYEMGKGAYKDITMIAVHQEQKNEPAKSRRSLRSMGNGLLQAIGIKPKEELRPPPSKQIAKEKRVKSLFSEEDKRGL
jgi:hypothetical protein